MDTKDRILQAGLRLYNSQGVAAITTRHIAASIGMSPGNLHYHFKYTDDIIKALYRQLVVGFDNEMDRLQKNELTDLDSILDLAVFAFRHTYRYRFIFLHFVEIARRIPAIGADYRQLTGRRIKEFTELFKYLVTKGIFRSDLEKEAWPALGKQVFIVADFWLSHNELTNRLKGAHAAAAYRETFRMLFLPYCAPK